MRPFFSYYGAKWTGAKHYGPPRHELVIEPFAGSASYATRWNCENVRLYDVSQDVCDLWSWLIGSSAKDVSAIPDAFEDYAEVLALPRGPQLLVRFWISKGRAEPSGTLSPWYFQWRNASDCRVWGPAVKRRIIEQKPLISRWTIERKAWWEIEVEPAHWHVDPPYNNEAGSRYPNADLSYSSLAAWCRGLPGHVDVCENVGATWLPFAPLYEVVTSRGPALRCCVPRSCLAQLSTIFGGRMTDPTPARDEAVLDHERIPTWPPLKKALWDVVTGEKLNDGHYINAYQLTDKLYAAAVDRVNRATDAEIGGIHRSFASAPAPASGRVDAARREAAMIVMEIAEDRDPDNVADMFRVYEHASHDCAEHTGERKPYGCGRCDVDRAYAAADRIRSALSPAATPAADILAKVTAMTDEQILAAVPPEEIAKTREAFERARAATPVSEAGGEIERLAKELGCEADAATVFRAALNLAKQSAKPASSPAGGLDVRFDALYDAFKRGVAWGREMPDAVGPEIEKGAYDYADKNTPPLSQSTSAGRGE